MRHRMRNPHGLKVRLYAACLIDLNEQLASFSGSNLTVKLVRRSWMKCCWIVCPTVGASRRICSYLIADLLIFKILLRCLNACRYLNLLTKVYYNLIIKKQLGWIPDVLFTAQVKERRNCLVKRLLWDEWERFQSQENNFRPFKV